MLYLKLFFSLILLLISYLVRTYTALGLKTYDINKPLYLRSGIGHLAALIIWAGLLIGAGFILYKLNPIFLIVGLLLYFFVFNFLFLKHLIKAFGGDLVFPESIHHSEGIIKAMIHAYTSIRKNTSSNEKELLAKTLKTRYPFMKNNKRIEIIENCNDIKDLIYTVLKMELIDFDVKKVKPIQRQIDDIIDKRLKEYS